MNGTPPPPRDAIEKMIVSDVQALSAESDELGRVFTAQHDLSTNDFRALLHVMVAESDGDPLTQSQLGQRVGVSGAAITYLVDRMVESGHLTRARHPSDRRKVLLRYADHGSAVARSFFTPLGRHVETALAGFSADDLGITHRVMAALIDSMRAFNAELRDS
ncbi:MarR family winged helix-turn-helix transcriptional regulator [Mycolicibacterium hodleri]|uniref:MarR family transcriptional regulator n=1 Tax=Mycolicibacterium hodleri TaxID=49897 RepID=A0A502E9A1_9MYCO|nr:MarR family winged helix-turn-helix transcriptional regulator [Mycolicibacterium hodleri]TPG33021.1 MarR family transcriptional regulator [Mycolicibacterium hodleri]